MRLKKILSLLLACVMFALMMTGCAGQTGANDGRISISIYVGQVYVQGAVAVAGGEVPEY